MITPELLKSDIETSTNKFHLASSAIFGIKKNTMRLQERFDCEFTKERRPCRALKLEGIALLPIVSEVLGRVVINRIKAGIDEILGPEQAGFREGKSTTEQIFILRNIIEQSVKRQSTLYINFIDFEKAFDLIHRDSL